MRTGPGWHGMTLAKSQISFPEGQHECLVGKLWIGQLSTGIPHLDSRKPETHKKNISTAWDSWRGGFATCICQNSPPWPQSFNSGKSIIDKYPKWSITASPPPHRLNLPCLPASVVTPEWHVALGTTAWSFNCRFFSWPFSNGFPVYLLSNHLRIVIFKCCVLCIFLGGIFLYWRLFFFNHSLFSL